jgi:hypothetical protein
MNPQYYVFISSLFVVEFEIFFAPVNSTALGINAVTPTTSLTIYAVYEP